ncbi:MAG: phospho-sugar mutase, partial [Oscillospiraceae bacterium]
IKPVPEQMDIDGNFPTVVSPNPENPEGFALAKKLAKQVGSDLIIGTDPDADRVGVMVRDKNGDYITISGNQMGVLLLDYIIEARRANNTLPENAAAVTTIVTTLMAKEVADRQGIHMDETFTGFKFMAEKLAEYKRDGSYKYLLAYEESYGYMMGDYVRDKDAVTAVMMISEMAAHYFAHGMTLSDAMESLYEKYGWFAERTMNLIMPGLDGLEKMQALMNTLRENPPKEISGTSVLRLKDYQNGTITVPELGVVGNTDIKDSNVLYFDLSDGCAFIVRPSGTEPKIKVYILARGENSEDCSAKVFKYASYAETLKQ